MLLRLICVLFLGTSIAACAQIDKFKKPGVKLYAMECGSLKFRDLDAFSDEGVYKQQKGTFVDPCFLIRHPGGDLIWDTGMPDSLFGTDGVKTPFMVGTVSVTLKSQLTELGLEPGDIDYLAMSHSHFDHSGNANLFAAANWLVDPAERDWMFAEETAKSGLVQPALIDALKGSAWTPVADDYDVFGDGTVTLVRAPGHTPGHMVLLLQLKNEGPVLLSGDLYHLVQSRQERRVPIFNTDREETLQSMDKFEALAKAENARVIIQHVPEHFASLPVFPAYLD